MHFFFNFVVFLVIFWGIWDSGGSLPQEIAGINTVYTLYIHTRSRSTLGFTTDRK